MRHQYTRTFACGLVAFLALGVSAQTNWTGGATSANPVTGDWNVAGNWNPSGVPASAATTILDFQSGTASYTSTNNSGAFTLNRINIGQGDGTSQVTIVANSSNALNFEGAAAGIYHNASSTQSRVTTSITAGMLILYSENSNAGHFRLNPGNNQITATELRITGLRSLVQGTQNNIDLVRVMGGATLGTANDVTFSTTAPIYFDGATARLVTQRGSDWMQIGGLHSVNPGDGRLTQGVTQQGNRNYRIHVADGDTYTFSGVIGAGGSGANENNRTDFTMNGLGTQVLTHSGSGTQASPYLVMASTGDGQQVAVNSGTLRLTEGAAFVGSSNPSFINGGIFQVNGVILGGTGLINVNTGGTLSGTGEIRRNVNATGNATLTSAGTLTIGQIATPRTLTVSGATANQWSAGDLRLYGDLLITPASTFSVAGGNVRTTGTQINNGGSLTVASGADITSDAFVVSNGGSMVLANGSTWSTDLFHVNGYNPSTTLQVGQLASSVGPTATLRFTIGTDVNPLEVTGASPFAAYGGDASAWGSVWTILLDTNDSYFDAVDAPGTLPLITGVDLTSLDGFLTLSARNQSGALETFSNVQNGDVVYTLSNTVLAGYSVQFTAGGLELTLMGARSIPEPGSMGLIALALALLKALRRKEALAV